MYRRYSGVEMAYELNKKVVLITGAANGIGAATVKLFAGQGVKHVAIIDIDEDAGIALQNELNTKHGANIVKFFKCDVTNDEQFMGTLKSVANDNNYIDIIINNAGLFNDGPRMYKKEIEVNVTALITGTLKGIELMSKDKGGKGGTVINISSLAGLSQMPYMPVYFATKSAVIQFSNCIGMEEYYSRTGVRVITVCFGATDTTIIDEDRVESIDELLKQGLFKVFKASTIQKSESAAQAVLHVYQHGDSGSTWICKGDKPAKDVTPIVKKAYGIMAEAAFS